MWRRRGGTPHSTCYLVSDLELNGVLTSSAGSPAGAGPGGIHLRHRKGACNGSAASTGQQDAQRPEQPLLSLTGSRGAGKGGAAGSIRGRVCAGRPEGHVKASNAMELACGRLEGPGGKVAVNALRTKVPKVKNRRQVKTFCLKVKPPSLALQF